VRPALWRRLSTEQPCRQIQIAMLPDWGHGMQPVQRPNSRGDEETACRRVHPETLSPRAFTRSGSGWGSTGEDGASSGTATGVSGSGESTIRLSSPISQTNSRIFRLVAVTEHSACSHDPRACDRGRQEVI